MRIMNIIVNCQTVQQIMNFLGALFWNSLKVFLLKNELNFSHDFHFLATNRIFSIAFSSIRLA